MQKLEESRQLLKTNENVINWLNKQVTENQLHRPSAHPGPGAFEMNSTGNASRALHNYSAPSYGAPGLSTSIRSEPPPMSYSHRPTPTSVMRPPLRGHYVQYHPGQVGVRSALPVSVSKSSPIGAISEEQRVSPQASPHHPSNQSKPKTSVADPVIDTRYLQRTDEIPLRDAPRSVTPTQTSLHFHGAQPSIPSSVHPTRLSKDAILSQRVPSNKGAGGGAGYGHAGMNLVNKAQQQQQQPPLASAYFPTQGKVT